MNIDDNVLKKISDLSKITIKDSERQIYRESISKIFNWVESLNAVDTDGIEEQRSIHLEQMPERKDKITDRQTKDVLSNAPDTSLNMFAVPKVVE